jgi:hypothetical protein
VASSKIYLEELARRYKIALDAIHDLPFDDELLLKVEEMLRVHFNTAVKVLKEGIKHGSN